MLLGTKAQNARDRTLVIKRYQCHRTTYRDQQFLPRLGSMPMWPDIAARLNGVEKTLTGVLVALVDVSVLAKARAVLCLLSQIGEVLSVESFHDFQAIKP